MATPSYKKEDRSKLDIGQQKRNAYLPCENGAGVVILNNLIPAKYSRIDLVNDNRGNPTKVTYYCENIEEQTKVVTIADTCSSLNDTYFILYSARDETKYNVYYSVCCAGSAPVCACATDVAINISVNDPSPVVALATQLVIECLEDFQSELENSGTNNVIITNAVGGASTNTTDVDTGFGFTNLSEGDNRIVATLILEYDNKGNLTQVYRSTDIEE